MRTRDEVLREFGSSQCILGEKCVHQHCRAEMAMADRIRELEQEVFAARVDLDFANKAASGKPVAWALYHDECERPWTVELVKRDPSDVSAGTRIVPLYAHPSAAAVRVTDAMVEAGCRAHYEYTTGLKWDDANTTVQHMWHSDARIALTAALDAAEGSNA